MNPQFPLYIVSKGRADSRLTSKALEKIGVPYHVVIERQEFDQYAAVIDPKKLLILDPEYQKRFDACIELQPGQSKGSGPARNFAWDHSVAAGYPWHWVMDDNIYMWYRLNRNKKIPMGDGTGFRVMEDFCLRFRNIAMGGPQYDYFTARKMKYPPYVANTRIFSCNLIRNDVPFRWRGRYNEDADLSLRMLKTGWCTVLFNAFLQKKVSTLVMKGGNTDEIYKGGTTEKSKMLVRLHPDVARMTFKFSRVHHHVDYRRFRKNKLVLKPGMKAQGINEYGLHMIQVKQRSTA